MTDCSNPDCHPYCPGCEMPKDHDSFGDFVFATILVALFLALFIIWFVYGPSLIHGHSNPALAGVVA